MTKQLIKFLDEIGLNQELFRILKDNGYFPEITINKILKVYQDYLNDKYDYETMMDILLEEENVFRYIFFSGYSNDIYSLTFDEFISEFVNTEYAGVKINKNGLSKKEIITKYVDEYFLNGDDRCEFMIGNNIVVIDEDAKRY